MATTRKLTPEQRAELRALCEGATPGWWAWDNELACLASDTGEDIMELGVEYSEGAKGHPALIAVRRKGRICRNENDATFIARSREALPAALDDLDAADAEIAQLKRWLVEDRDARQRGIAPDDE